MVMAQPNRGNSNPNNSSNNNNTSGSQSNNPGSGVVTRKSNLKFVLRNDGGTKKETFVVNTPLKKVTIVNGNFSNDDEVGQVKPPKVLHQFSTPYSKSMQNGG